jgi:predicted Holliday junction resolvase-like endonuclease
MDSNGFAKHLVTFLKTARHLWGRCPSCSTPFRLSDAAITSNPEPPRDWLRKLQRREATLAEQEADISYREAELLDRVQEVRSSEYDIRGRESRLERDAKARVREILASKTELRAVIREANKVAVKQSRATLLGRMMERLAPCFRKFGHDPRDMRCICDPVDYVLFEGLTLNREVSRITFIEVKSGRSRLTGVQRSIREAVQRRRVDTSVWQIGEPDIPITQQIEQGGRRLLSEGEE